MPGGELARSIVTPSGAEEADNFIFLNLGNAYRAMVTHNMGGRDPRTDGQFVYEEATSLEREQPYLSVANDLAEAIHSMVKGGSNPGDGSQGNILPDSPVPDLADSFAAP